MNDRESLELLSDRVRKGEPIGFLEAIAVIDYQTQLKVERNARRSNSFFGRLKRLFLANARFWKVRE